MILVVSRCSRTRFAWRSGYRAALHDRAAAARTSTGRASKTVIAGHDLAMLERARVDVPQENGLSIVPLHPELLVEIAVINFATPPDTDRVAAHETFNGRWIECLNQKLHVLIKPIVVAQVGGEAANWKIRKGVKPIEHNAEMILEFALVIVLKLFLRRRQKSADWIVHEMQWQGWIDPVT